MSLFDNLMDSRRCSPAMNLFTLSMCAIGAWITWRHTPLSHDDLTWFAFFCWASWYNVDAFLEKLAKDCLPIRSRRGIAKNR